MKQTIRLKTFETNSSSAHSMVICEGEEQEKLWQEGKLYTDGYTLFTKEELYKDFEKELNESDEKPEEDELEDLFKDWLYDNSYHTKSNWKEELERETNTYTTKSGDKIYIHCCYGYDG